MFFSHLSKEFTIQGIQLSVCIRVYKVTMYTCICISIMISVCIYKYILTDFSKFNNPRIWFLILDNLADPASPCYMERGNILKEGKLWKIFIFDEMNNILFRWSGYRPQPWNGSGMERRSNQVRLFVSRSYFFTVGLRYASLGPTLHSGAPLSVSRSYFS